MVAWGSFGNWVVESHLEYSSPVTPRVLRVLSECCMRHTLFDRLRVSASVGAYHPVDEEPDVDTLEQAPLDTNEAEFGRREGRLNLERKLLRKLDMRMSILILIYILNYVRRPIIVRFCALIPVHR